MFQNVRIALRTLLRWPSFAAIAVLTLGLGIGATTAIFTVVNTVVLEPLEYPASDRLVRVEHPVPLANAAWRWGLSEAGFFALRAGNRTLEDLAVYEAGSGILGGSDGAVQVSVQGVSANLFDLLGGRAVVGRLLEWSDNAPGGERVVVLSRALWETRFGGDPAVVGSTLDLNGVPAVVVGVVEAGFDVPNASTDVWQPVRISPENAPVNWHRFDAIGRLRPAGTADAAEADLNRVVAGWPAELPTSYSEAFLERTGFRAAVVPLKDWLVGPVRSALWVLLGAVSIVLLIGCVNVANLFLVRLEAGRRETAMRTALGASWRHLAGKWLAETSLIAAAAGVLGLGLAGWGIAGLVTAAPDLPRLDEIGLAWESVAFTAALTLLTAMAFGLLPVVRDRTRFEWLREGAGVTASRERNAARRGLVVFEIALALVLLAGAGLMLRTFQNLRAVDPGLEPEGALTMTVALPFATYRGYEDVAEFQRTLSERVGGLPGVAAVGATTHLPMADRNGCAIMFTEDPAGQENMDQCFATPVLATPGYFQAMGIEVEGRTPSWLDMEGRRGGVVVTRAFAEQVWPRQSAIGQTVKGNGRQPPYYHIVGEAEDIRADGPDRAAVPQVYFPMLPIEGASLWTPPRSMTLVVRTTMGTPTALAGPVREVIRSMDPGVAVGAARPMTAVVAASMQRTAFIMLLLGIAAAVALALGVIGLYGVISYVVAQRRTEIGIRIALGADRGKVRRMVVRQAAALAGVGVAVGGIASLGMTRVLATQLYGVDPRDPLTLLIVGGLLVTVALVAAWIPASAAARVDPMTVLRGE